MKKKILFIIPSLEGGGAERVLINIIKYLNREKSEILLILYRNIIEYNIDLEKIKIIILNKKRKIDLFKLIVKTIKIFRNEKPDVVMSIITYTNLVTLISYIMSRQKFKLFLEETIYLSKDITNPLKKIIIKQILKYSRSKKNVFFVAKSLEQKKDLVNNFGVKPEKCFVIGNPIDINDIKLSIKGIESLNRDNSIRIISCGRLEKQKNYPLLLKAFSIVKQKVKPIVKLVILGKGKEQDFLMSLSRELKIENDVKWMGFVRNPFKFFVNSDIFILPSNYESFGNVIVEAMACGLPVISTNCPSGPSEIIKNEVNGILVPVNDEIALAEAIIRLVDDPSLRKKLAEEGRKRAEAFRAEKIVKKYEELFGITKK